MKTFISQLKQHEAIAEGTAAFYFEKPPDFEFQPGQFADFTLINPPETDAELHADWYDHAAGEVPATVAS